jgi:hypothetical protein
MTNYRHILYSDSSIELLEMILYYLYILICLNAAPYLLGNYHHLELFFKARARGYDA